MSDEEKIAAAFLEICREAIERNVTKKYDEDDAYTFNLGVEWGRLNPKEET